ncbi:NAD(P)-binding protein [Coniochaeta ligniaria NRRL 30616]|uniref:NAD(P)-binding protein n=1 Tax=Coniochaeta ligniaria NRRL 30616 TaxID=1408157 RepID=A0A1J7IR49_9PEZI|nr:NAD(P)-binding protein [Coniochaeta ligniaria NRRL 30616]
MDSNTLFNVKGKVILITGGGKGIGRMISEGFVSSGCKVYISSRSAADCDAAAASLNALASSLSSGGSAFSIPADLSREDECKRLAAALAAREEKLHVLVHNSGAAWGEPFDSFPDSAWGKVLTLNLQRVFTLTQRLMPLLEAAAVKGEGEVVVDPARIINIGSIDALRVPVVENFAYSASKAGLHHLSRHLAVALGPRGVTCNTIACGPFPSRMLKPLMDSFGEQMVEGSPLGRIGQPQDVAGTCLFLSSRAGAFVNGATIALDGGISLLARL